MYRSFILAFGLVALTTTIVVDAQDISTFYTLSNLISTNFAQNQAKTIVRLAFHDAMGGLDGQINSGDSEHNGLVNIWNNIGSLYSNNQNLGLNRADFFAWTYIAAFYMTLGDDCDPNEIPWVSLQYGRTDVSCCESEDIPPDSAFGSFNHADTLTYFSTHFGFDATQSATIMGAHTLGGADTDNTGFTGDWTNDPNDFNNEYYETMVDPPGQSGQWEQVEVGTNKFQWRWGCNGQNGCQDLMLNVDMSLLFDISYDSTGKAVLPSGSSCSSDDIFDDCFPAQSTGTQDTVNTFMNDNGNFLSSFAATYASMVARTKTSSSLTTIDQPSDWPNGLLCMECFSKSTTVHVENVGLVEMQDLQIGDRVWTGNQYEPVYAFGHRHEHKSTKFLAIHTEDMYVNSTMSTPNNKPLEITANHLLFKEDENDGSIIAVTAGEIDFGDRIVQTSPIDGIQRSVEVVDITMARRSGLYMPLTPSGTILVNGVFASTYVSIAQQAPNVVDDIKLYPFLSVENLSHWWMSPYRMMCLGISSSLCMDPTRDWLGILQWLSIGKKFAEFADKQGFFVRVLVLGVPTYLLFGFINLTEVSLGGPSIAPAAVLAIICVLLWRLRNLKKGKKQKTL